MTTQVAPIVGPQAQKSLLTIQKATVKKQLLYAEFTEQLDLQAKPRPFTMQSAELIHSDLEACFAKLVPHFCLLTEQLTETVDYWPNDDANELPEHFDNYQVTGLIMGKKNGVTLMGFRTLESGKVLNMTGQYVSFEPVAEEEEEADIWHYAHAGRLETEVLAAIAEVELALRGKCSDEGRQLDMFAQKQLTEQVVDDLIDSK